MKHMSLPISQILMLLRCKHQSVRLAYHRLNHFFGEHQNLTAFTDTGANMGFNSNLGETSDPTDVVDADAFEELTQNMVHSSLPTHDQPSVDDTLEVPDDPGQPANQTGAGDEGATSVVVVDQFPSGHAGVPIPGMARGSTAYESSQALLADSVWAPFKSQNDWGIAHWAKMRGLTSSAVAELLAIPEVCDLTN
jgi:hypothetical protein